VSGCACHGGMGLAHVACLVRQAEMSVKEKEEENTGVGFDKWAGCYDCGQRFHGAVQLALARAAWKTYVGRPESDNIRCFALELLGCSIRQSGQVLGTAEALHLEKGTEALPVLEAALALRRRYYCHAEDCILGAQNGLANCFDCLERHDEALVLRREIYTRRVATLGVSHYDYDTITSGRNLSLSLVKLKRWDEAKSFARKLLPVAQQSLGADDDASLALNMLLAGALWGNPECTRGDLRFKSTHSRQPPTPFGANA